MKTKALDLWLWVLMSLVLLPALVALDALPFAQVGPRWVVPLLGVAGFVAGGVAVTWMATQRHWWTIPLRLVPLVVGLPLLAALLIAVLTRHADALNVLLGAFTMLLAASMPWLVYRASQPFFALVPIWVTVAGAWATAPTIAWRVGTLGVQSSWWVSWLLVASLLLIGLSHLRAATARWQQRHLAQLGPVFWPAARAIVLISIIVAFIGLIPFTAQQVGVLAQFWRHTPLSQGGPLAYDSASGNPIVELGAPLAMNATAPATHAVILTYTLTSAPATTNVAAQPMLLGATLDTFAGQSWSQSPVNTAGATQLPTPTGADMLQAQITVQTMPRAVGAFVLGFAEPLSFTGVAAQPAVSGGGPPTSLNVAHWQAQATLDHTTYTTTAAVLPVDAAATGTLPADFLARMTAVPASSAAILQATARQWAGGATTPAAQAQALLQAFHTKMTRDEGATPTGDPVLWCLQHQRGGTLLLTTTYLLLARSLGLPVRLAEGYEGGSYDVQHQDFAVHADDATVWAQLAIPGRGWADLFPAATVYQVLVPVHTSGSKATQPTPTPQLSPTPAPAKASAPANGHLPVTATTGRWLLLSLTVVLLLALAAAIVAWRWAAYGNHLRPLARFFARVGVLARLAGIPLRASDTATQATAKVADYAPPHKQVLVTLNDLYEQQIYGAPGKPLALPNLRAAWQRLRGTFWQLVASRPLRRRKH